jgi:hypothetical protein
LRKVSMAMKRKMLVLAVRESLLPVLLLMMRIEMGF